MIHREFGWNSKFIELLIVNKVFHHHPVLLPVGERTKWASSEYCVGPAKDAPVALPGRTRVRGPRQYSSPLEFTMNQK